MPSYSWVTFIMGRDKVLLTSVLEAFGLLLALWCVSLRTPEAVGFDQFSQEHILSRAFQIAFVQLPVEREVSKTPRTCRAEQLSFGKQEPGATGPIS